MNDAMPAQALPMPPYCDENGMKLLDEFRERVQRLSLALTRIECESSDDYAKQLARTALYGKS